MRFTGEQDDVAALRLAEDPLGGVADVFERRRINSGSGTACTELLEQSDDLMMRLRQTPLVPVPLVGPRAYRYELTVLDRRSVEHTEPSTRAPNRVAHSNASA